MNVGLLSVLIAGFVMYDDDSVRTSGLGALLIAGAITSIATKGGS